MFTKEEIVKNLSYIEALELISEQLQQIKVKYVVADRSEKVQLTKARKKLEDDQEYLKKLVNHEIPRPKNAEEMKKHIDTWLESLKMRFQNEYNQFMTDIVKPPSQAIYAVRWRLEDFVGYEVWMTWHFRFTEALEGLEGEKYIDRFFEFYDRTRTDLSDKILSDARSGVGRSTSLSHNLVEQFQFQAEAQLLNRLNPEYMNRLRQGWEIWKILNS